MRHESSSAFASFYSELDRAHAAHSYFVSIINIANTMIFLLARF